MEHAEIDSKLFLKKNFAKIDEMQISHDLEGDGASPKTSKNSTFLVTVKEAL